MLIECLLQRDSVCMADDIDAPHDRQVTLDVSPSVTDVPLYCARRVALDEHYLASVMGGSTWIAYAEERPIAVVVLDRFLRGDEVHAVASSRPWSGEFPLKLFFAYYLANSPARLVDELRRGETPRRISGRYRD